jgi:arginyl-tRNA synthetase
VPDGIDRRRTLVVRASLAVMIFGIVHAIAGDYWPAVIVAGIAVAAAADELGARLVLVRGSAGDDPEANIEVLIGQLVNVGGAKLSKRAGNIIELRDLVDWIGKDAVRYSLARYPADTPLELQGEDMIKQSNDNPVFYVQYAHSRTCSIDRNAADRGVRLEDGFDPSLLNHESESALLGRLTEYPRIVAQAAELREPHRVARYLEALAGDYHSWYNDPAELRANPYPDEAVTDAHRTRLWLNDAVRTVLANGLDLLGVSAPEQM